MLMTLVAVLLFALGIPLAAGRVGPNRLYGFRTPRTLADERVWYPVNRMTGQRMMLLSMVIGVLSVLGWVGVIAGFTVMIASGGAAVAALLSMFVSAAKITAQIDAGGPRLDLSSSFEKNRKRDLAKERKKLLDKLR